MDSIASSSALLRDLARHQAWADAAHFKALRENTKLLEDSEIRNRLNHTIAALRRLTRLAKGETEDRSDSSEIDSADELQAALERANSELIAALDTVDHQSVVDLPRGPRGPWRAPAGVLLLQAVTHSQHHRGQNASRMRQLGAAPPLTDFLIWYALGRP
jgi:uncharacterized damage-inducible protein DinB